MYVTFDEYNTNPMPLKVSKNIYNYLRQIICSLFQLTHLSPPLRKMPWDDSNYGII